MADSKIHPPSASRIEEARATGLAPRPLLVGLAGGCSALLLCVAWQASAVIGALRALLQEPLHALAEGRARQAETLAQEALRTLAYQGAITAGALLLGTACAALVAQGPSFGWPAASKGRGRFAEPAPARSVPFLAGIVLVVVAGSLLPDLLWVAPAGVGAQLPRLVTRVALFLAALAIIDAALARAAFFRALWLSRREQRDEHREAYGSPEIRATRERIRRESAHVERA